MTARRSNHPIERNMTAMKKFVNPLLNSKECAITPASGILNNFFNILILHVHDGWMVPRIRLEIKDILVSIHGEDQGKRNRWGLEDHGH